MALLSPCAFSPSATLHPDISTLVCTPVESARRQLKSTPRLWLPCIAAKDSNNSQNGSHASVAVALAANSPCARRLGVSFFSASPLFPDASTEFFESFFTHLIGFSECDPSCAAAAAPDPAGPCAAACSAPNVSELCTTKSTIAKM